MPHLPDPFESRSTTPQSDHSRSNSSGGSTDVHVPPLGPLPIPASPITPANPNEPLLASTSRQPSYFVSSPLNPHAAASRPQSRGSVSRIASEESYGGANLSPSLAVGPGGYPLLGNRDTLASQHGSMLLYRLASDVDPWDDDRDPMPPGGARFSTARYSVASDSGQSAFSVSSDSKYPVAKEKTPAGAFLAYAYDPTSDQSSPPDADDALHDPSTLEHEDRAVAALNIRGFVNVLVVGLLITALVCLFTLYPILTFLRSNSRNLAIDNNVQVNGTGQVAFLPNLPDMVDKETPDSAKTRKGWDGKDYELVFSDEFNTAGRTFYPGDDPFWEAVDLWYGATADLEWYDPGACTEQ